MHEIARFEFNGHPIEFQKRKDGEWWASAEEVAEILGYASARKVLNLYARHADEFLATETCVLKVRTQDGQRRDVRFFSPKGVEHLAILGRTATCVKARRFILNVMEQLRTGGLAELEGMVKALIAENKALRETVAADRTMYITAMSGMAESSKAMASLASQIMNERKAAKAVEDEASDAKQLRLWRPWTADGQLGDRSAS